MHQAGGEKGTTAGFGLSGLQVMVASNFGVNWHLKDSGRGRDVGLHPIH